MSKSINILIVGGGLAGLSSAIALAKDGFSVTLIEANFYDSFRVGEHLSPDALNILEEFGVSKSLYQSSPTITSIWGDTKLYTSNYIFSIYGNGVALWRPKFDFELAQIAKQNGVKIEIGCRLQELSFSDKNWSASIFDKKQNRRYKINADFIIDASGRSRVVSKKLGISSLTYDKLIGLGYIQDRKNEYHNPIIEAVAEGWWYSANLPNNRNFTMLLTDSDLLPPTLERKKFWLNSLQNTIEIKKRFSLNSQIKINGYQANTTRVLQSCGEQWLAIGDAVMSFDPLSSGGIAKALHFSQEISMWVKKFLNNKKEAQESYREKIRKNLLSYFESRSKYYRIESRFSSEIFWYRRHLPHIIEQPIRLPPKVKLQLSLTYNEKSLKHFFNGIAPKIDTKHFFKVTSKPKAVIDLLSDLQTGQSYGYPNQEKIAILQLLVREGCLQLAN